MTVSGWSLPVLVSAARTLSPGLEGRDRDGLAGGEQDQGAGGERLSAALDGGLGHDEPSPAAGVFPVGPPSVGQRRRTPAPGQAAFARRRRRAQARQVMARLVSRVRPVPAHARRCGGRAPTLPPQVSCPARGHPAASAFAAASPSTAPPGHRVAIRSPPLPPPLCIAWPREPPPALATAVPGRHRRRRHGLRRRDRFARDGLRPPGRLLRDGLHRRRRFLHHRFDGSRHLLDRSSPQR